MIYEPSDLAVDGYIRFTVPKDYHDYRYGRIHKITDTAVYVVSWYDAFVGYEYLKVPYKQILEYKKKFVGIGVDDEDYDWLVNTYDDE